MRMASSTRMYATGVSTASPSASFRQTRYSMASVDRPCQAAPDSRIMRRKLPAYSTRTGEGRSTLTAYASTNVYPAIVKPVATPQHAECRQYRWMLAQ